MASCAQVRHVGFRRVLAGGVLHGAVIFVRLM